MQKIPDIVTWAESAGGFYLSETKAPIILAEHQKAMLRHCFTADESGKFPYETVIFSAPKKSGKTTIAALVAMWFGLFVEPPNELFILANSLEQSVGRSFKDLTASIRHNPVLRTRTNIRAKDVTLDNETIIQALSSDYAGAAGSRHGLTVWDELWAYSTENNRRLWDELTPVPTKTNSLRLIVTYAGFEGESTLLEELHKRGIDGDPVPELANIENGRGEPACRATGRLFCYWDHELKPHPGLTVTPAEYHEQQRQDLRPGAFARLHLNEWASSISRFVTAEQWRDCYSPGVQGLGLEDTRRAVFGADASTARDLTALVGVVRNYQTNRAEVVYCRTWKPRRDIRRLGKPTIDLTATIGAEIARLHALGQIEKVHYDPYQLHSIALSLISSGVKMEELPQTTGRTAADQALYDAIIGKSLAHYNDPVLNEHVKNAVAIESARGYRLAKEKTTKKIDAAVALSMAHYGLSAVLQEPAGEIINFDVDVYRPKRPASIWETGIEDRPRPRTKRTNSKRTNYIA